MWGATLSPPHPVRATPPAPTPTPTRTTSVLLVKPRPIPSSTHATPRGAAATALRHDTPPRYSSSSSSGGGSCGGGGEIISVFADSSGVGGARSSVGGDCEQEPVGIVEYLAGNSRTGPWKCPTLNLRGRE